MSAATAAPLRPPPRPAADAWDWLGEGGATARTLSAAPVAVGAPRAFARAQAINARRHAEALRPFRGGEFGAGPASPTDAHLRAANRLVARLRNGLRGQAEVVGTTTTAAERTGDAGLAALLREKDRAGRWVKQAERIWDFYFELFGQRQSRSGEWLLATDRIALDCYQAVYTGLGRPRSVPAPPPFCFMATGFTPSTYRRGVPLTRLGRRANPFPIVQLPYHRLVNPWTLGAVHHEVSHNLQSDLGLWQAVPRRVARRLVAAGLPPPLALLWARWNKEIWADLCALLLGGPAIVASLIDVVALAPTAAFGFNPRGVHPTPVLRVPINLELLRRMGFGAEADAFADLWRRLYPIERTGSIPPAVVATFPRVTGLVVDEICFQPYPQLGGKTLAEVVAFNAVHQAMTREAAQRLAVGVDPGIVPARFLVGAARHALDHRLAPPDRIAAQVYAALNRR